MALRRWLALLLLIGATARAAEFGPAYLIERIDVRGNVKTAAPVIVRQLLIKPGETVRADDPRVEVSRYRVLALGFFSDAQIRLAKGSERGRVVLVVEVVERGTLILNQLWFGTSDAVPLWAGVDASENNWGGTGFGLGGAFVFATRGDVPLARPQQAYRLRFSTARILGTPFSVALTALYNDASEPFRVAGRDDDGDPKDFLGVHYRRVGGIAGVAMEAGPYTRLALDYRLERVDAELPPALVRTFPDGRTAAVDPGIHPGESFVSTLTASFDRDTRNDPILPTAGTRVLVTGELSSRALRSSYDYVKVTAHYQQWFRLPWGHVLSPLALFGAIVGDAPLFDRYYIGDLNPLLPPRALGLTMSTQPSRNLLGTGIARERYGAFAARVGVEYLWPLFRSNGWFYAGHAFAGAGALGLASAEDLRDRTGSVWQSLPIDLYFDAGVRIDTYVGIFTLSVANLVGRLPL